MINSLKRASPLKLSQNQLISTSRLFSPPRRPTKHRAVSPARMPNSARTLSTCCGYIFGKEGRCLQCWVSRSWRPLQRRRYSTTFQGRAYHFGSLIGHFTDIEVCSRFHHFLASLVLCHIEQIIVIHGVQGIYHRLFIPAANWPNRPIVNSVWI